MLGDQETTRRADGEAKAYSDGQMIAGLADAVNRWRERVTGSDREQRMHDDSLLSTIFVLDVEELAELHAALSSMPQSDAGTPLFKEIAACLDDLDDENVLAPAG